MMPDHENPTEASVREMLSLTNNVFAQGKLMFFLIVCVCVCVFLSKTIQARFSQVDVFLCKLFLFLL